MLIPYQYLRHSHEITNLPLAHRTVIILALSIAVVIAIDDANTLPIHSSTIIELARNHEYYHSHPSYGHYISLIYCCVIAIDDANTLPIPSSTIIDSDVKHVM